MTVVFSTMMAPPCGTASRAREIPMTPWPRSLSSLQLVEVQKANATYSYFLRLILEIIKANLFLAIEDPRGGWMWSLSICLLGGSEGHVRVRLTRWTGIVTNCAEF
jgi:hypothetical protein